MQNLWPSGTRVDEHGELWLGGCAASALADRYGTPLYAFDEATIAESIETYRAALAKHYPARAQIAYAAKAGLSTALAQFFSSRELHLDVVSAGEMAVALRAGFPASRIHFHGNNKSRDELTAALAERVGRIVVDNFHELGMLSELAAGRKSNPVLIWLRLAPGVEAHTHAHILTGQVDTKFGFDIAGGDAERAVTRVLSAPGLDLVGLHAHIGSQICEPEALAAAAAALVSFAAEMRDHHGLDLRELSPGDGWGVPMTEADPPAPVEPFIAQLAATVVEVCRTTVLALPRLVLEPGRSLVARAGVALYRIGARKEIPGVRTYVAVDGGMADNIRPALYGAAYTARLIPGEQGEGPDQRSEEVVTLAGKFCESGDLLVRDISLPSPRAGDLVAIPMSGAYTLSMASNYNMARRPAVVWLRDGQAFLIQRRECLADLVRRDVPLGHAHITPQFRKYQALGHAHITPRFRKYQALGNDYLVLNPADWPVPPTAELVERLCDRHRGVGADGVLWGPLSEQGDSASTFVVRGFNPDGSEFEKSGNGLRIFARYLWDLGLPATSDFTIGTAGGPVVAHVLDTAGTRITLGMGQITFASRDIPVADPLREAVEEEVTVVGGKLSITAVGIGNPHCVIFVDEATPELARTLGPVLERLSRFPNRTNVQFAQHIDRHTLRIEIWERGAGYTLTSGTSSCAAAAAAIRTERCASPVTVVMPGGEMLVEIAADWTVRLTGSVTAVCSGEISREVLTPAAHEQVRSSAK